MKRRITFFIIPTVLMSISLIGCKKDKAQVSQEEFKKALSYLQTQEKGRNYTASGESNTKITKGSEVLINGKTTFNCMVSGFDEKDVSKFEGSEKEVVYYYHTDEKENYVFDTHRWTLIDDGTDILPSIKISLLYQLYSDRASTFVYHNGSYQVNDVSVEFDYMGVKMKSKISCFITFENKKIVAMKEKAVCTYSDTSTESGAFVLENNTNFTNYNGTTISDMPQWEKPTFTGEVTDDEWGLAFLKLYSQAVRNYYCYCSFMDYPVSLMSVNLGSVQYYNIVENNSIYQVQKGGLFSQFDETGIINEVYDYYDENELVNCYIPNSVFCLDKTDPQNPVETEMELIYAKNLFKYDSTDRTYKYEYKMLDSEVTIVYTVKFNIDQYDLKSVKQYSNFAKDTNYGTVYDFYDYGSAEVDLPEIKNYIETENISTETKFKSKNTKVFDKNEKCLYYADFSVIENLKENDTIKIYFENKDKKTISKRLASVEYCMGSYGKKVTANAVDGIVTIPATGLKDLDLTIFATTNDKVTEQEELNLIIEYRTE